MLPCCALGMMLVIQLTAFTRWFMRVILRKPQIEDEQEFWKPEKVSFKDRLAGKFSRKNRYKVLGIALVLELAFLGVIYIFGGFDMARMGLKHMGSFIYDTFISISGG